MWTNRNNGNRKKIPIMPGRDSNERLRALRQWANVHLPEGYQLTLDEIGQSVGITRERVRQIEASALRKCRHPIRISQLE